MYTLHTTYKILRTIAIFEKNFSIASCHSSSLESIEKLTKRVSNAFLAIKFTKLRETKVSKRM